MTRCSEGVRESNLVSWSSGIQKFSCTRYSQAKKSDPITSPELAHLGPFRYHLTTDHKTGRDDVAVVLFPIKEEWEWLGT